MAYSSYADVVAGVGSYLARADLVSYIPDFIVGAETRIAYGSKDPFMSDPLRVRAMETTETLTPSAGAVSLPTGFLGLKSIYEAASTTRQLEQTSPEIFYRQKMGQAGHCGYYIIEGNNIVLGGGITSNIRVVYYKKFDPLATANPVPWLLTEAPLAYVYGALIEASPFIRRDDRVTLWHGLFRGLINSLNASDKRDRWGGSALASRTDVGNP